MTGKLSSYNADTGKVRLLYQLSIGYASINTDSGLLYARDALALATKLGDRKGTAEAHTAIGENLTANAAFPEALNNYFKALSIYEDMKAVKETGILYRKIGLLYYYQDDDESSANYQAKALEYQQRSLDVFKRVGEEIELARALINIGLIYQARKNNDSAKRYFWDAYVHFDSRKDNEGKALAVGNLANIYLRERNYAQALANYDTALEIYTHLGEETGMIRNTGNIGICYFKTVIDSEFQQQRGNGLDMPKEKRLELAVTYLTDAVKKSGENKNLQFVRWYAENLCDAYKLANDYKNALTYYEKYITADDSINSFERHKEIVKLETDRQKQLKDKQIVIDRLEVAKKRNERIYFAIGLLLLAGIIAFIAKERKKSERLLLNILPAKIAKRLKKEEHPIADHFNEASIMFIDMVGFTPFSQYRPPKETVRVLNEIFTHFDTLADKYGMEKIKTIGDCYMVASGIPTYTPDHANCAADMALELQQTMKGFTTDDGTPIQFRIGLDCGPVVAGVIGSKKFIYDLWGDAVNTASRMQDTGVGGEIHCTTRFKNALKGKYYFTSCGVQTIKGKGSMETWLLYKSAPAMAVNEA